MGRGRAKAKQTKVARDLKYRSHETDFGALARELHGGSDDQADAVDDDLEDEDDDEDDDYSPWSDYDPDDK
jgi:hypothetical protein